MLLNCPFMVPLWYLKPPKNKPQQKKQLLDNSTTNRKYQRKRRFYDNLTKQWILVDTGAQVSCVAPTDDDKVNPHIILETVDGSKMPCYGTKVISLRIGRKTYTIEAIIAAVPAPIFGWDIFKKYRVG